MYRHCMLAASGPVLSFNLKHPVGSREALERQLGAVQDADMMELLASVGKLKASPLSP